MADETFKGIEEVETTTKTTEVSGGEVNPENEAALKDAAADEQADADGEKTDDSRGGESVGG